MPVLSRAPKERQTIAIPTWDLWLTSLVTAVNEATVAANAPAAAGTLTGTTLAPNVVNSSLVITDGQLSSNVALKNGTNAFTGANSFANSPLDLLVGQLQFPATQNPSSNANMLDDYEESPVDTGWTPVDASGAGLVFTSVTGDYLKWGLGVLATGALTYPVTASGANVLIGGLPFTSQAATATKWAVVIGFTNSGLTFQGRVNQNTTIVQFTTPAGVAVTNTQLSASVLRFTAIYRAAA